METPGECVKSVQSQQQRHQKNAKEVVRVPLLLLSNRFIYFSGVFIDDFEQVSVVWVTKQKTTNPDERFRKIKAERRVKNPVTHGAFCKNPVTHGAFYKNS